ncbi:MAG: DNA polymerase III subunit epsilon [Arcobacter sp.]|nr:MAG: DNA polymerase III subunit epsilon [Arcobacter sp.]
MPKLLFLDLETSGLEEKDRLCELGLICEEENKLEAYNSLCKSKKKISSEAMALHHITNESLEGAPSCEESKVYKVLQEYNNENNILICHNMKFSLDMLAKEGFSSKMRHIDTHRCTKALIQECGVFNLQFLRYELLLYKQEEALAKEIGTHIQAHRAGSDALHIKLLYASLLEYATLSQLIEISSNPILLEKFPFGKYSGRYIEEIVQLERGYLTWMRESIKDMDEDLAYSLHYYLEDNS